MNSMIFNSYADFGVFIKINLQDVLDNCDSSLHENVTAILNSYENTKGGCGCNLQKRKDSAKTVYKNNIPLIFADQNHNLINFCKTALSVDSIEFKQDDEHILLI